MSAEDTVPTPPVQVAEPEHPYVINHEVWEVILDPETHEPMGRKKRVLAGC